MTEQHSSSDTTGLPLWQQLQFDLLLGKLDDWRNADHEDAIAICRSDIIAILEGVKALRAGAPAQLMQCCKGLAPESECRCEQERRAAGHPPYQRSEPAQQKEDSSDA